MLYTQYPNLQSFIDHLRFEKRYSKHTLVAYQKDLEDFFIFLTDDYDSILIKDVTASIVRTWLAQLKEEKLTAKSINRKISSLKSFFKFLMKESVVESTPMSTITSPKISKRLPVYVEQKDIKTLFDYVEFPDNWNGTTERLLLQLFYNTGIRVSELINLKTNYIDIANGNIKVLGKGNKERIIPVGNELIKALQLYIQAKPETTTSIDNFFITEKGRPFYARQVYNIVKKYLSLITTVQKKSPHILRHSFATHLTNNGADLNAVKELLGHSSLAATQVYIHNSIDKLKEVFKKAHPKA